MARFFDVHPDNPQARSIQQIGHMLTQDALIAYPTDSGYALGCRMDYHEGVDRIRRIRQLSDKHHFTLMCADFAQLGYLVMLSNTAFRAIKASTPGPYTFILPATAEVPRRLAHAKKKTVGVRIPQHAISLAIVKELGEPMLTSTLLLPGMDQPLTSGWEINELLGQQVDAIVEGGDVLAQASTVVDYSQGYPQVLRYGAGDASRFE